MNDHVARFYIEMNDVEFRRIALDVGQRLSFSTGERCLSHEDVWLLQLAVQMGSANVLHRPVFECHRINGYPKDAALVAFNLEVRCVLMERRAFARSRFLDEYLVAEEVYLL